ncbi:hypothetical protein, partial [Escherichia coli]|uniref:hypothetical protein n=1 Tax=Escherichia coli TaxID=562 RepID=UPI0019D522FB
AYFKAKHLFFRFGWKDVKDDCDFILRRYFGGASLPDEFPTKHRVGSLAAAACHGLKLPL